MSDRQEIPTIIAASCIDPEGSIVESGRRLADAVISVLQDSRKLHVDLVGIKGASSSYFNVFLLGLTTHLSLSDIAERISFRFSSNVQKDVLSRSLDAVRRKVQESSGPAIKS